MRSGVNRSIDEEHEATCYRTGPERERSGFTILELPVQLMRTVGGFSINWGLSMHDNEVTGGKRLSFSLTFAVETLRSLLHMA